MNFLQSNQKASYVLSGSWSEKAIKEAKFFGTAVEAASTKENKYRNIPALADIQFNEDDAYVHITSNNTIYGTQWHDFPETGHVPLVADMSSDIFSKPVDISKFGIIYAGAQKKSWTFWCYCSYYP